MSGGSVVGRVVFGGVVFGGAVAVSVVDGGSDGFGPVVRVAGGTNDGLAGRGGGVPVGDAGDVGATGDGAPVVVGAGATVVGEVGGVAAG